MNFMRPVGRSHVHGVQTVHIDGALDSKAAMHMLWTIIAILLVLWLLGFLTHVGGGLIHLLLVVAVVVFLINLFTGRNAV